MKWFWLLFLLGNFFGIVAGLVACQQKPTLGVTESGVLVQNQDYRKVIVEKSVVFDTRSPFEFNTNKVPGSINLPVSDFQASLDLMDAARRLSLYGVNPSVPAVIIGDGKGDEQKLAWEFIKLGVTQIETLKVNVFRLMNVKPEGLKKNVALWKPEKKYAEINQKEFSKRMRDLKPRITSNAKAQGYKGFPVGSALRKRVLVVNLEKNRPHYEDYSFADHLFFQGEKLFDEKGLLNRSHLQNQKIDFDPRKYDVIFLFDTTDQKYAFAYALVQFGARSLYLVR